MRYHNGAKRVFDLVLLAALVPIALPLSMAAAMAILLTMGGPVLFRQQRVGLDENVFTILKFRTMRIGSGPDIDRLTRLGAFLRKTSIDELPQLANIARGEMSFVGPRPLLLENLPWYSRREQRRHMVRPGLTGLAQVNGRNTHGWDQRLDADVEYVETASFLTDVRILAWTVVGMIRSSDVIVVPRAVGAVSLPMERGRPGG